MNENLQSEQMGNEIITWIIPAYNAERYIIDSICSILGQPCRDLRVIVVDDGSKDSTYEKALSVKDSRLQVFHKENGGVSTARNFGVKKASSPYIAFLDADDVLCRNFYDNDIYNVLLEEAYDILDFSYAKSDDKLKYGSLFEVPKFGGGYG